MTDKLDAETRQLAAMAYGESSPKNVSDEMFALASILRRQRDARGYKDIATFASRERNYSFVTSDRNVRYLRLMNASDETILKDAGMKIAVDAAKNALVGGPDKSNGAWFWDGADISTNYAQHEKVLRGIKIMDPSHNIYGIKDSSNLFIKSKHTIKFNKATGVRTEIKEEEGRYEHVYESTAAYGGTIFWRFNPEYIKLQHAKEYK